MDKSKPLQTEEILGQWIKRGSLSRQSRVQNASLKPIALGIACFLTFFLMISPVFAYQINGNMVSIDNSKANIKIYPHTIRTSDDIVNFNFTSKIFSGKMNLAFGFDTDLIWPVRAAYNNRDISSKFENLYYDYGGMDKWYYVKDFEIAQGKEYNLKFQVNINQVGIEGKYWVCAWKSSDTISEAVTNNRFWCLDPWFNVSFMSKKPIDVSCPSCSSNTTGIFLVNDTAFFLGSTPQYVWCNMTTGNRYWLYYNDETDYQCVDPTESFRISQFIDEGNGTGFGLPEPALSLWFHLNNTDINDSSIYGNNGVNDGTTAAIGQIGSGVEFISAQSDNIEINSLRTSWADTVQSQITMMAWFNYDDCTAQTILISLFGGRTSINCGWTTNNKFSVYAYDGGVNVLESNNTYSPGSWHHVAATIVDGTSMTLYIDGISQNTVPIGNIVLNPGLNWCIGGNKCSGSFFDGDMDEVRIFNRTLSDDEIQAFYNNTVKDDTFAPLGDTVVLNQNTSLLATPFNINDISFSSSTYVLGFQADFNTTRSNTTFALLSSMNIEKLTGGGTNIVTVRVRANGNIILEEDLRTVTGIGNIGSSGTRPVIFSVGSGIHNITYEFKRTGTGSIGISNIDMSFLQFFSANEFPVNSQLTEINYSHSSLSFEQAFNWTMIKDVNSSTYIVGKQTITKSTADPSIVSYLYENLIMGDQSPFWTRYIPDDTNIGSVSGVFIDPEEIATHNHSISSRQSDPGSTIFVNGSLLNFDMRDSSSGNIENFQTSDILTNLTQSRNLSAGTTLLASDTIDLLDGNGFYLSMTSSFKSTSGSQTPIYFINSSEISQAICFSEKERTISDNDDIGNAFIYLVCTGISPGTYTFNLYVIVESGETLTQLDESLNGFNIQSFNITEINVPPLANNITNPVNGTNVTGSDTITWLEFTDPNGGAISYLITLRNLDNSLNSTIGSTGSLSFPINWDLFGDGINLLNVQGSDPSGLNANSTITITVISIPPVPTVSSNITYTFPVTENLPIRTTFCDGDNFITERERLSNTSDGVAVLAVQTDTQECVYGCSDWTFSTFGNAGCIESDFTFSIFFIIGLLIMVLIIRKAI